LKIGSGAIQTLFFAQNYNKVWYNRSMKKSKKGTLTFTKEQEELRQKAKNGDLGIKFDDERNRWDLLPWREIEQVVKILTFGAKKYADDNWKYIPDLKKRYFAAAMRHLVAWQKGEMLDQESGENHLSHALCCILFLLWDDNQSGKS